MISALRKSVTAKCCGSDGEERCAKRTKSHIEVAFRAMNARSHAKGSRRKLLKKQKEDKKRMRQFGRVDIPQEAFIEALKMGD